MRKNFWFYIGVNPVFSIRMQVGSTNDEVRVAALDQNERVPLCDAYQSPREVASLILHAEIRTFENEG